MEKIVQPTAPTERHSLLDVLRGFALLGVLLANMVSHSGYFFLSKAGIEALGTAEIDHIAEWIEHFLIDGKFYSLFSMLFGIGFALQMKRSSALDTDFTARFRRRLVIMFVLGLLHAILLYVGDILTVYALTGFVLLLFRKSSDKVLLRGAVILMLIPIAQYAIMWAIHSANPPAPVVEEGPRFFDQVILTFRTGSYPEIMQMNIGGLIVARYPDLFFTGRFFRVLAMFLIGFYISRNMIYANIAAHRPLIRKVMIWGAVIGIPCNIVLAMMMTTDAYYDFEPTGIIQPLVYAFGVPGLALCYAAIFALLFENPGWKKRLMVFAPVGQLALTNYIMQSLICACIFMSYGLALEAQIGPARLALIAFAIYTFQIIFSHIWIRYFRFGPMEWIWRSLTYKKWQPFRI
ncbi:DUF418 domain-containing protein [Dyadobacter pollutisoli]|uniref:DUF418 domain-containing protein n=1 Tax=Dyadobacter pollutisoli TaxID=2910158 RepID=A0A9E8NDR2_9BACT|nr:DUF418 domain-containing protein [Dyadobacter pollutisoli]WAC12641.1 DUF418 domain-containing protein [Dyadobacter pollutisoli]